MNRRSVLFFLINLIFIFLLFQSSITKVRAQLNISDAKVPRKVFVLTFNPVIGGSVPKKLSEYMGWSNPDSINKSLVSKLNSASNNYLSYSIKETKTINGYPIKADGFQYTNETYLQCINDPAFCHEPDSIDYSLLFQMYDICNKDINEVWLWGGPWFGYYEFNPVTYCDGKTMFVMGFNYERQLGEALHDFGHRMEYVAGNRVNRGLAWEQNESTEWNKYSLIDGHCGNIHYPPGTIVGEEEYIYNKKVKIISDCEGYMHYPTGPFNNKLINCDAWHCTQDGYVYWWLNHIPNAKGISVDSKTQYTIYNNWWKYYAFYDETYVPPTPGEFSNLSANLSSSSAQFNFNYSGISNVFEIDMSTVPDMSWDVYLNFGSDNSSPILVSDPQAKWDKYSCGATLYWQTYNQDRTIQSPIQTSVVSCPTPTPTPTIPTPTLTPTPTRVVPPTPTPTP